VTFRVSAAASVIFPSTVRQGTSKSFCSMYPTWPVEFVMSRSPRTTDPVSGLSSPEITLNSVDFPHPEGPTSEVKDPAVNSRDVSASATLFAKVFLTPLIRRTVDVDTPTI